LKIEKKWWGTEIEISGRWLLRRVGEVTAEHKEGWEEQS
jgi:hypothetical protein